MAVAALDESPQVDVDQVFTSWLASFGAAMTAGNEPAVADLLTDDCWWRDLLALTWDLGTYQGASFGVFGFCKPDGSCSGIEVGYDTCKPRARSLARLY